MNTNEWRDKLREYWQGKEPPTLEGVEEIVSDLLTRRDKEIVEMVEEVVDKLKKEIRAKEGNGDWSDTGKVAYYYLDRVRRGFATLAPKEPNQ